MGGESIMAKRNEKNEDREIVVYLDTNNCPELQKVMDKVSEEVMKKNEELYRRLADK